MGGVLYQVARLINDSYQVYMEDTMIVPFEKRYEYWNHLVAQWALHGPSYYGPENKRLTPAKLREAETRILLNDDLWADILLRHSGMSYTPEALRAQYPDVYEHAQGNFWGQVQTFINW